MDTPPEREATRAKIADSIRAVMDKTDRLLDTARPEAVYAAPVAAEGRTIIAAAEVMAFAGFGGGGGLGPAPAGGDAPAPAADDMGMGAGVGGAAYSRPVAVIIIDRDGARVEPVVDVTKLGLAALTTLGGILFLVGRMLRAARRIG